MFGMGGSEIIVILIVALLFLGPDKLPQAAKSISKGIRDIKKQSRSLQQQIESDEQIGGAIRDLKSALRGEDAAPVRPKPIKPRKPPELTEGVADGLADAATGAALGSAHGAIAAGAAAGVIADAVAEAPAEAAAEPSTEVVASTEATPAPALTMPATAGEADPVDDPGGPEDDAELASMIKRAPGSVAKGS